MRVPGTLSIINCLTFLFISYAIFFSACAKEFSYERQDVPVIIDSTSTDTSVVTPPAINLPVCEGCINFNSATDSSWSFTYGNEKVCGSITNAVITPGRDAFTFFGPSYCSLDSGMIITAYLGTDTLDRDKQNLTVNQVIFDYYDNVAPSDIFLSNPSQPFYLVIDKYTHSTHSAIGSFRGIVFTEAGRKDVITSGRFNIVFNH